MSGSFSRFDIASLPIGRFGASASRLQPMAPDSAFEIASLPAPASGSVDAPCTVTLTCGDREKVKVRQGVLFWSGQAPFERPAASLGADHGEVNLGLHIRDPGRHELTGRIVLRERPNGGIRKSTLASAGRIMAR